MRARLVVVLALTALAGCTSEGLGKAGNVLTSTSQGIRNGSPAYMYQAPMQSVCTPNGGGFYCSTQ